MDGRPKGVLTTSCVTITRTTLRIVFQARKRYFASPAPFSSISFPARGKRYGLRSKACALCLRQHLDDLSDIEIVEVLLGIAALHDRRVYEALLQQRRLIELPADEDELRLLEIGVAVAEYRRQADGLDLILVAAGMAAEIGKLLFISDKDVLMYTSISVLIN